MPHPIHEQDDLDPKEFALRVVTPAPSFEDHVRSALERVGFEIERLIINPDDSMATCWVRRLRPLPHLENLDTARATLLAALSNAGCPCNEQELDLAEVGGQWRGAYFPILPEDILDPMRY